MKKLLISIFALFITISVNAQSIVDYFPITENTLYHYQTDNSATGGKILDEYVYINEGSRIIDENETQVIFVTTLPFGKVSSLYQVMKDRIILGVTQNIMGQNKRYDSSNIVLKLPGQKWRVNSEDPSEWYEFSTTKSSISSSGTEYSDCILLKKVIFVGRTLYATEYSYYAKDVGLVYSYTTDSKGKKSSPKILIDKR